MNTMQVQEVLAKYSEDFKKHRIFLYMATPSEDMLLVRWWMDLTASGDIAEIRNPAAQRLITFLNDFQPPSMLLYALDESGSIDFACWLDAPPADGQSIYHGNWTAAKIRGTKRQYQITRLSYQLIFEFFPAIIALTWQPELLPIHEKIGYITIGTIPNYLGHSIVYQVYLTKENFYSSRFYRVGGR